MPFDQCFKGWGRTVDAVGVAEGVVLVGADGEGGLGCLGGGEREGEGEGDGEGRNYYKDYIILNIFKYIIL